VDNRNLGGMFTLVYRGHSLGVDYQRQTGDTGMPFIGGGTDPYTLNTLTYHHFLRAKEDSWQTRYDYDFAAMGVPGLTLMARYVHGDDFQIKGANAEEWERDVDLSYVVQSGPLKNLGMRLRNVAYRGSHTTDIDENRLILSYTFKFW
ncbi:MAG TPA: OprD family outer membrane porin, partial [Pseudomonas sp.]|nr:OprD family outer membrane porin [Pseudomonas sp.]